MNNDNAVSFCDFVFPSWDKERWEALTDDIKKKNHFETVNRVYVGSYFCECYFKRLEHFNTDDFGNWLSCNNYRGTLVIPVSSEKSLVKSKDIIRNLLDSGLFDEVVVNDVGMLKFVSLYTGIRIILGRLFSKATRDPRNLFIETRPDPDYFWNSQVSSIYDDFGFGGIEADIINMEMDFSKVPRNIVVAVHKPWTYISTGRMCAFAGTGLPDAKKFLPDISCKLECMGNCVTYEHEGGIIVKAGRALLYPSLPADFSGHADVRTIYMAADWGNI